MSIRRETIRPTRVLAGITAAVLGLAAALVPVAAYGADLVDDWDDLVAAVAVGGEHEVTLDADLSAPAGADLGLVGGDDLTLDLNGHHLQIGQDGAPADDRAGIHVPLGAEVTITDSAGGGKLTVTGGDSAPAIGAKGDVGTIRIQSGTIVARGGRLGAGIGGGHAGPAGTIIITGGTVTASSPQSGAGIGGGLQNLASGSVTISGGTVTATGGLGGAGIGGGNNGAGGIPVTISGGRVTATGHTYAAGIGGGANAAGSTIVISGGIVTAHGGSNAAAIGAGWDTINKTQLFGRGTLTLHGTAYNTPPANGVSGTGVAAPGRGGVVTLVAADQSFRTTTSTFNSGGRLLLEFGWVVSLDANGGTPADPDTVFVPVFETVALPDLTRDGHLLADWRVDTVDGAVWDPDALPASDLDLVARWLELFSLDYDLAGGTLAEALPAGYHVESDPITLAEPERAGHVFTGWTGTGLASPTRTVTIPTGSTGDRSYVATWEADTPTNLTLPTISGDTGLGDTLTADPGTWDLPDLDFTYQWYRGATAISGATSPTYTITADDHLETLSVEVTATRSGDDRYTPATERSAGLALSEWVLDPTPVPVVDGDVRVGSTLTADPGTWGPGAVALSYQWRLDGEDVAGADSATFIPRPADVGRELTVAVTGSRDGYAPVTRESVPVEVGPGVITLGTPGFGGSFKIGTEVWTTAPTPTPATATVTLQWLRDGVPIPGATGERYLLTSDDAGAGIRVRATATLDGYADTSKQSAAFMPAAGDFTVLSAPGIAGTAGVGHELTLEPATWSPEPQSVGVRWLRDDVAIDGATASTYTLTAADEGAVIRAEQTAHAVSEGTDLSYVARSAGVTVDAMPAGTPVAPDAGDLVAGNRNGVTSSRSGSSATLEIPGVDDGRWVYVYGFSVPAELGWHRVSGGQVTLSVAALDAGEHRLAVLTADGSLAGWAPLAALPTMATTGGAVAFGLLGAAALLILAGLGIALARRRPGVA